MEMIMISGVLALISGGAAFLTQQLRTNSIR